VWAEIVNGNVFVNHFGVWKLYIADFVVRPDGTPTFENKRDITPQGARWVEPGNFSPDGRHMLISSDIGMADAYGQDQFELDTVTGQVRNLTNSPTVWDEHGVYSPDGKKIVFMSSYPYRDEPNSYKVTSLKTDFMLMDSDGTHLQQLTHFNVPGYPESQPKGTVAAVATFAPDGSKLFSLVMAKGATFTNDNWTITFDGNCGNEHGSGP
jgi:Tol biopolymer transport system component